MKFRIDFELPSGEEDHFFVTGDSIEEIREKAHAEIKKRAARNPSSTKIEDA